MIFKNRFSAWIPAFAGMTVFLLLLPSLTFGKTLFGIDVLEKDKFRDIAGANVGLITNQTGVNRRGKSTVDILHKTPKVNLVAIFTPEHGFRGNEEAGKKINNDVDSKTGVPIYSLYGKTTAPTPEMLKGIDILVFDIQDIGTRFYTYITTMGQALEVAAKNNIRFVVLDRPNPIRGDIIEGDILNPKIKRFTGYFAIPTRHGLTVGELARWTNQTNGLEAKLRVIEMKNWDRSFWFDQTGHEFLPPSPNIPSLTSALLYAGIGNFEATNVSVGRGTNRPFEIFGAPWINGRALTAYLREQNFKGVTFAPIKFKPESDVYKDSICEGVQITVSNRSEIRPFQIFIASFLFLIQNYPKEFEPNWDEVEIVTGSGKLKEAIREKKPLNEILDHYINKSAEFQREISSYYLY